MKLDIFIIFQTIWISFLRVSLANIYCIYFIDFEELWLYLYVATCCNFSLVCCLQTGFGYKRGTCTQKREKGRGPPEALSSHGAKIRYISSTNRLNFSLITQGHVLKFNMITFPHIWIFVNIKHFKCHAADASWLSQAFVDVWELKCF